MNELLAQLFGSQPSYAGQLLGEDEARRLQQQAQQSGLLNVGLALLAGAGPSPQRRGVGELLAQGVMAGQQAYQGAYNRALQEQALKEQIQERQQLRQEQMAAQQLLPQILRPGPEIGRTFYGQPTSSGIRDEYGNLFPGAEVKLGAPQLDLNTLQQLLTRAPSVAGKVLPTVEAFQKLTAPKRMTLKEGEQVFEEGPGGLVPIAGIPKVEKPPAMVQEYEYAVNKGYPGSFEQFKQLSRSVTNVNVGEGQKGLENEMKVSGAFKAEPVYKAFDEMRSSYKQITTGLDAQTPAGDLTAATKFMKLLDPGSVVRESELFLAMQATGLIDKFSDYSNRIIKGTKLTESQRQDFRNIANELYNAAANSYNTKRQEYVDFGRSQGLKGEILLGKPADIMTSGSVSLDAVERARRELERRGLQ